MAQHPTIAASARNESAPPPPPPIAAPSAAPRPLQFSVRFLLSAMTIAAVALAALSWLGMSLVAIFLAVAMYFVVPVFLGTLAIYCRGYRQTFFAGVLAGATAPIFLGSNYMYGGNVTAWLTLGAVQIFAGGACGATALATRRLIERRGWHVSAPTCSDKILPE